MTDVLFVGSAYVIVLGGLSLYVASVARRLRNARRIADALERQRDVGPAIVADTSPKTAAPSPQATELTQ